MRFSALGIEPFLLVHSRAVVLPTHHCNAHPFPFEFECIWTVEVFNLELSKRDVPLQRGVRQEVCICPSLCVILALGHRLRNGISFVQHVGWESAMDDSSGHLVHHCSPQLPFDPILEAIIAETALLELLLHRRAALYSLLDISLERNV